MGDTGRYRFDRDEVRVRRCAVRRVYGARRRRGQTVVRDAYEGGGRQRDHDDRGVVAGRDACPAKGVDRGGRAAVRLLPIGPDNVGGDTASAKQKADRYGHRPGNVGRHLPLRHVQPHPKRHKARRYQRR